MLSWVSDFVVAPVIAALIVLLLVPLYRWLFGSKEKRRRRIYRRALRKQLEAAEETSCRQKASRVLKRPEVRGALEADDVDVLREWFSLRDAMTAEGIDANSISGASLYDTVRSQFVKRRELVGDLRDFSAQLEQARLDPRFGATERGRRWTRETDEFAQQHGEYCRELVTRLDPLRSVEGTQAWADAQFKVVAATLSLSRGPLGEVVANVTWPENPFVAHTRAQRDVVEKAPRSDTWAAEQAMKRFKNGVDDRMPPSLVRFSAGGSLTVISVPPEGNRVGQADDQVDYIVVGRKDETANIDAGCLVPSSGLSERKEDWDNPLLIVANECVEEIRIRSGRDWLVPNFYNRPDAAALDAAALNLRVESARSAHAERLTRFYADADWVAEIEGCPPETIQDVKVIKRPATVLSLGDDRLIINGAEMRQRHLLVLDPNCGAVDVMAAVRIEIDRPLSALRVLDGEAEWHVEKLAPRLLWRNVYVFRPHQLARILSGRRAVAAAFFGCVQIEHRRHWLERRDLAVELPVDFINTPLRDAGWALLEREYPNALTQDCD